jgi:phosphoribosylaminoimidazole-succinocarboxamide synthase
MTHPEIGAVVPNHLLAEPHPNVTVARYVDKRLPVELVMRKCLAESSTTTSIAYNYFKLGRRTIYGIDFPEGLEPNQEFPEDLGTKEGMGEGGIIITPTTKGEAGAHDEELTNEQAAQLVDSQFGDGTWEEVKALALRSYVVASRVAREGGILIADTKQEWGFMDGKLGLIDEVFTPDSSRFWLVATYAERLAAGQRPQSYDKEMARKRLDELGYHGGPDVPVLDPSFIDATGDAYKIPYQMISGQAIDYIAVDSARIEEAVRNHLGM